MSTANYTSLLTETFSINFNNKGNYEIKTVYEPQFFHNHTEENNHLLIGDPQTTKCFQFSASFSLQTFSLKSNRKRDKNNFAELKMNSYYYIIASETFQNDRKRSTKSSRVCTKDVSYVKFPLWTDIESEYGAKMKKNRPVEKSIWIFMSFLSSKIASKERKCYNIFINRGQ